MSTFVPVLKTLVNWDADGNYTSNSPVTHVRCIHDMLQVAARDKLNVWMFLPSIDTPLCDEMFANFTKTTLSQKISDVLSSGASVSIMSLGGKETTISLNLYSLYLNSGSRFWVGILNSTAAAKPQAVRTSFVVTSDKNDQTWRVFKQNPLVAARDKPNIFVCNKPAKQHGKHFRDVFASIAEDVVSSKKLPMIS